MSSAAPTQLAAVRVVHRNGTTILHSCVRERRADCSRGVRAAVSTTAVLVESSTSSTSAGRGTAAALPSSTARLAFRWWDPARDAELATALWGDKAVTALIGGPFDAAAVSARLAAQVTPSLPS